MTKHVLRIVFDIALKFNFTILVIHAVAVIGISVDKIVL